MHQIVASTQTPCRTAEVTGAFPDGLSELRRLHFPRPVLSSSCWDVRVEGELRSRAFTPSFPPGSLRTAPMSLSSCLALGSAPHGPLLLNSGAQSEAEDYSNRIYESSRPSLICSVPLWLAHLNIPFCKMGFTTFPASLQRD